MASTDARLKHANLCEQLLQSHLLLVKLFALVVDLALEFRDPFLIGSDLLLIGVV